jgi:cation transport regulator ChaB
MHTRSRLASPRGSYAVGIFPNPVIMLKTAQKHLSLILVIVVSLGFVGFALAHETDDPVHMDAHAQADANVGTSGTPPRPLDLVRQKALEIKQGAGAKADMRVEMKGASSSPEKRPLKAEARIDIAKERQASSSNLMRKIKDAVHQHAGLIKQRFGLALRQFEQLSARIETRLEKMKAEGVATASVEAELAVAKTANVEAKADVQAVADFVASVDDSADRAAVRTELQALIKEAQTSIREAHQALQKVVRSLVALGKENKPKVDASTSVETEATVTE